MVDIRKTPNSLYHIVGRWKDGQYITGYQISDDGGDTIKVSKDRLIYLIGKGLVRNARIQPDGEGGIIIRGKGVNLNKLPTYDEARNEIKCSVNGNGVPRKNIYEEKYEMIKRVMHKTNCVGYVLKGSDGKCITVNRNTAFEMAKQKLIEGVVLRRSDNKESGTVFILRGTGDKNIANLPIVFVDENGRAITEDKSRTECLIAKMNKGGKLVNVKTKAVKTFNIGDYLVCYPNAAIDIATKESIGQEFNLSDAAWKDNGYMDLVSHYEIELFSGKKIGITKEMVYKWTRAVRIAK